MSDDQDKRGPLADKLDEAKKKAPVKVDPTAPHTNDSGGGGTGNPPSPPPPPPPKPGF